jgi:NAD(P)H dehydrogenase (quinone)
MRVLVVYCHPCSESFTAAVRDVALDALKAAGHEVRLLDLHALNFDPVMGADERRIYNDAGLNEAAMGDQIELIKWTEKLVFIYPTWWFGLPAMLKGWLDRVWVPHVTFTMPTKTAPILPNMINIRGLAVITTCGATWWMSKIIGEPGRKTILRGIRALCAPRCRRLYLAHYKMDTSTQDSRKAFLAKVRSAMSKF